MSEFDIANQLARITLLPLIDFEKQLAHIESSPHLIPLLAHLLSSDLRDNQKQLAAVGINKVITHRLNEDYKQWSVIWQEYLQHVLRSHEIEKIEWRHLLITGRSLAKLMEQFQESFCNVINPVFKDLNFKSKAIIYDSFLYAQSTEETKYVFVRQTIEDFLGNTLDFISASHDSHEWNQDAAKLEGSVIENLGALLKQLSKYNEGFIYDMMIKISLNMELFLIIVEELLFDPKNPAHESVIKKEFSPERMNQLVLFVDSDHANSIKASIFKIYCILLCQYDLKSGIEEFDQYKYLYFMENLTPIVIHKTIILAKDTERYIQNQDIIMALLTFLLRSCKFNFMLQTFQNSFQKIFYEICLPFLETTEQQRQYFHSNYNDFIKISEELIESHETQTSTIKNSAGKFTEELAHIIHGSLLFIVENSIQTIRTILLQEQYPQIVEAVNMYGYKPTINTSLIMLSLFSSHYLQREDLYLLLKQKLLSIQKLLQLRQIQKARFLMFLAYNYEKLYKNHPQDGSRFLIYADRGLDEQNCISNCSLMVFQNCLKVGFGDDIWQNFIIRIEDTTIINIFKLLNEILQKMLDNLPIEKVDELISKVIQRLVKQFRKCQDQSKQKDIKGNEYLYLCLDIVETIVQNEKYLKEQRSVIESVWPIFDLFQFSERIEFEDNILAIFNKILAAERHLVHQHFLFVPYFNKIYEKQNGFMDLLQTIIHLLTKGREYLLTESSGKYDLQILMNFIKCTYGVVKNQDTLKCILVFFHYIYLQYSSIVEFDHSFYEKLMQIYETQKSILKDETKASIINFLLICQDKYGCCDLQIIKESRIEIFQGYQSKIFSFGLRNIIEKDYERDEVLNYLRYSIRLLHFIREVNLRQEPTRHHYYQPNFPQLCSIDPFNEICMSLNFVKRKFEPSRYDMMLKELNTQISLGEIKDLLSRRIIDNSLRTIKRVKHQ